jgi:hypothetical protein
MNKIFPVLTLLHSSSKSILILSSHTELCLWRSLFLSGFPTKFLCNFSRSAYMPHAKSFLFHIPPNIWRGVKIWISTHKYYTNLQFLPYRPKYLAQDSAYKVFPDIQLNCLLTLCLDGCGSYASLYSHEETPVPIA